MHLAAAAPWTYNSSVKEPYNNVYTKYVLRYLVKLAETTFTLSLGPYCMKAVEHYASKCVS